MNASAFVLAFNRKPCPLSCFSGPIVTEIQSGRLVPSPDQDSADPLVRYSGRRGMAG
jgi:hypothetical protein